MVVVGEAHDPAARAMHTAALATFLPRRVIQWVAPSEAVERPLPAVLRGMLATGRAARAYACSGTSCSPPAADLASWRSTLESLHPGVPA
jgi:uncharacterized protein YyaL (SSP411 family)